MLYDVLPPLLLFISFGGIIIVFSRVILRMRHVQFSEDIQAQVNSKIPIHEESLLKPDASGVTLVKNRLGNMLQVAGSSVASMRARRKEAKQLKAEHSSTVQMPEVGLQDKLSVLAQKGREGLSSLQKEIANRIPDMQTIRERIPRRKETQVEPLPTPKSSPAIRLVRHTGVEEQASATQEPSQKAGIMSQLLKRDKEKSVLDQAAEALANNDFEAAEDILIPHIMKHSGDTKAYMLLGKAAIGKESWDEAMEIFQQVIKIDKGLVDAYSDLGHAALNAGKFTLAIQSLQHARDMDASNIRIREELLFIARRMDNKVVEKGVLEEL
ncbi:MAG: hypothetical protein AAB649_00515, partial [Patescibacteria group bacterium]